MKREKTALVLGGGGARGAYEAGVWQALIELGKDIDIVTGASVGAINGAMVAQGDLDNCVRLWKEIETHMIFDVPEGFKTQDYALEFIKNRGASASGLQKLLDDYVDEEKVRQSAVDFGMVVVEKDNLTPHYVFKDDIKEGQINDYILASASVYPALKSHKIDGVDYIDGGYADVLPIDMARKRGATEIIAVYLDALGFVNQKALRETPNLTLIQSRWDLGTTLIFDTHNARRIMRLGYLDTMKAFDVLDGEYYTFAKGAFDKGTMRLADACAHVFDMNPLLIYTKDIFLDRLHQIIVDSSMAAKEALEKYRHLSKATITAKGLLEDLKTVANDDVVTFLMAYNLKEKGADSVFLSRAALRIIPEPVLAARFLVKYELI